MSTSRLTRVLLAATMLCLGPAIASAQAPQTKACKDGTSSSRSTFACLGHGGVDPSHTPDGQRVSAGKHHAAEPVQAGEPRGKHTKATAHRESKASAHHAEAEHRDRRASKTKQGEEHRGWLPWRHKKAKKHKHS